MVVNIRHIPLKVIFLLLCIIKGMGDILLRPQWEGTLLFLGHILNSTAIMEKIKIKYVNSM
jgi:hypothetical protein